MKMTLNVNQRISIAQFLPKEGNMAEQLIGKSIIDKTMVTKEERKNLLWDPIYQGKVDSDTDFMKDFEFSNEELELLYSEFLQMDQKKTINLTNIELAVKIREAKMAKKEK